VDEDLQSWVNRGRRGQKRACANPLNLWDALRFVTYELSNRPGRRVILAVTNGYDGGSKHPWNELRTFAQASGVTIFGLAYWGSYPPLVYRFENPFNSVCELSGGMVMLADEKSVAKKLKSFTALLRGRYIVEFPRPLNGTVGEHNLIVKIDKSDAFIRPAGISVPIADPALMADPTTIPPDPSQIPAMGKRRVLTTPQ
jgi:hypothetical protein